MHDEVLMRVAHGRAHLQEELHAVAHAEMARIAPGVDGLARHEFHDHVGHAAIGGATIEQPRDVAMVETGENLAFDPEAPFGELAAQVGAHELDGHFGVVLLVVANRLEHIAHAAGAQHSDDAIGTDALADAAARRAGAGEGLRAEFLRHRIEERARLFMRVEQRLHLGDECRVATRFEGQKGGAILTRKIERRGEQRLHGVPMRQTLK